VTPNIDYSTACIVNASQSWQVISGTPKNALEGSESTLQSSMVAWEDQEALSSTGEGYRSDRVVCV
jgi:hypothetical protein